MRALSGIGVLLSIIFATGTVLTACGGQHTPESVAAPPVQEVEAVPTVSLPATPSTSKALPTPADTPVQPASPTPPPTATIDLTVAVQATQTAAAFPPTPLIVGEEQSTVELIPSETATSEPLPTPMDIYSWTLKVPILMYHYISEPPPGSDIYRVDLSVSPDDFRQQMAFLSENGYTPVDLNTLSLAIVNRATLPEKPVIITFDDGYLDAYENAFPILQEYGFEGTFFIITELIDLKSEGYMSWEMIEEMSRAGQRIESHSKTHPDLTLQSRDSIIYELLGSLETLAAHTGYRPRYLCYPAGRYNDETIAILKELDYWGAVTTMNGTWHGFDDRFEWRRVRIRNTTSITEFGYMLDMEGTLHGKPPSDG
ncbi:MAG: polysaccharide deacetylase family protein [Candidatus Promineofilum sp.]|nr:polysaccharide deacetylase family protein [Promineifilum sp.]